MSYQLIGRRTEAVLFDGVVFTSKPAVLAFEDGDASDPDGIRSEVLFVDVVLNQGTTIHRDHHAAIVEFCVVEDSESEHNLIAASMASMPGPFLAHMYVRHANGKCYEFSQGRISCAGSRAHRITAVFRSFRQILPATYEALRGPIKAPVDRTDGLALTCELAEMVNINTARIIASL